MVRDHDAPSRDAAAADHHRARPAVAAVGLERQPPARSARLPSDRPGPCGLGGLRRVRCSRARHRPAPCCSLRAWGCLVKGRRVASSYPAHLRAALRRSASRRACAPLGWCGEKDASHRLLQPTPVTSTLRTAVFPVAPRRRSPPCGGSRRFERRLTLGRSRAARGPWGDLAARVHGEPAGWSPCLTAGLQLRRAPQPSREPPRGSFSLARELCPGRCVRGREWSW